ncbi:MULTISPECIES: 5-oxoprolinase subunit PxpB [unclassified Modicisalibacter]|uniref:5-oxoprolinase subunit PxpB n=1 Tax=unclassified Modicisalibacter TaxID=2679913 RepID=UPI001CCBF4E9|nr:MULTISPECIES: 5-oxoprolinase subunit PxpB [unclassified Modicisalibacter]MBZ9558051.1 5-oxoprolinase subunit PxpB [Modicisalibacter sp. R2A 31.J]MBZ9573280.1 5-oxoprolinase subunit PxpB [Modicisalibacter sp. MOD 31.J]
MTPRLETVGMDALIVRLFDAIDEANMPWLTAADSALRAAFDAALIDLVPSYTTLLVQFDVARLSHGEARARILEALDGLEPASSQQGQRHVIPVWYDASVGPELSRIAERLGVDEQTVIDRHCARDYCVFALGFAPGYGFMGLVEEALATPRLKTPRQTVAAGSVGIADRQTAIYPLRSPGGWNILGRSAVTLFDRERDGYSLLRPGDRVRFEAVSRQAFIDQGGDPTPLEERQ